MIWLKRALWVLGVVVAVAAVAWFVWPRPVPVDLATATLGPMEVTIDEEARSNLRHVYTVTAPVTGTVLRIANPDGTAGEMSVHVSDHVISQAKRSSPSCNRCPRIDRCPVASGA